MCLGGHCRTLLYMHLQRTSDSMPQPPMNKGRGQVKESLHASMWWPEFSKPLVPELLSEENWVTDVFMYSIAAQLAADSIQRRHKLCYTHLGTISWNYRILQIVAKVGI